MLVRSPARSRRCVADEEGWMRRVIVPETPSLHDGEPVDWWTREGTNHHRLVSDNAPQSFAGPPPALGAVYGQLRHVRFAATGSKPG